MKSRIFVGVAAVCVLAAVALLWARVQTLEDSLETLQQQVEDMPNAVRVPVYVQNQAVGATDGEFVQPHPEKKQIFRLLESKGTNEHTTPIGVPWNVERAMLQDAQQTAIQR